GPSSRHPPDSPVEPQISFNSHAITPRTVASGSPAIRPSPFPFLSPLPIMAAAGPTLPVRLMAGGRNTAIMGSTTRWGLLVDRLLDGLEVGLGLFGRGGCGQGAVEGGGQGLGNRQGGPRGADPAAPPPGAT